jgi:hypothetical protein
MVEDGEGCYVGVKRLGIVKVANPRVVYYGLNEDLDATLSGLMCVCVDLASTALGLSHDGLSSHRAVLPAPLGAAVNKG